MKYDIFLPMINFIDISNVQPLMAFLFRWQKFHYLHCHVNRVYHVLVRENRLLHLEHLEVLHQQPHHGYE